MRPAPQLNVVHGRGYARSMHQRCSRSYGLRTRRSTHRRRLERMRGEWMRSRANNSENPVKRNVVKSSRSGTSSRPSPESSGASDLSVHDLRACASPHATIRPGSGRSRTIAMRATSYLISILLLIWAPHISWGQPPAPTTREQLARDKGSQAKTDTARISGRVVGLETGWPIRRALVRATISGGLPEPHSVSSDAEGRWELSRLPAGRYTISWRSQTVVLKLAPSQ